MKTFKILILLLGTISLMLFHNYVMRVKGIDLFQFMSFFVLHGIWYDFCMKIFAKRIIYRQE
jgi:hypothetical protein